MAINTAMRRRMAAGVPIGLGVTPDANEGKAWRWQVGWSYVVGEVFDSTQARQTFPGYVGDGTRTFLGTVGDGTRNVPGWVGDATRTATGTVNGSL